ncbi:hypothetical protein BX600DRAFT_452412 [Xylariales sp. PMI_506]|nr:hypothetical protein BX600DRAFT_452412 [Xylariales sp. PMI_506]
MSLGAMKMSGAMRRSTFGSARPSVCQICDGLVVRQSKLSRASFTTRNTSEPRAALFEPGEARTMQAPARSIHSRWITSSATTKASVRVKEVPERVEAEGVAEGAPPPRVSDTDLASLTNMVAFLENSKSKVLGHKGIPSEADVAAALQACSVVADYITDDTVQPQLTHIINEAGSTASTLLSLDSSSSKASKTSNSTGSGSTATVFAQLEQMVNKISETAYLVIAHPTVVITPALLKQYVEVQYRLSQPETLPRVMELYATKPLPREVSGAVEFTEQNRHHTSKAIDPETIEMALETAIEAKNLDAAIGIVENSYATKAFTRAKIFRKTLLPGFTFIATPFAAYPLAKNFAVFQDSMDAAAATNVAFAGILAYVGFTASIGMVAVMTANDQMMRVSWAPGIPLRTRWIREEERAALDQIACAWGFREKLRHGEEEGPEWDALREYIGQKGMVLDRSELIEGME